MAPPPHGNTKGYQVYIHHVHIADGFTDDCEELIHRWLKTETLTYETFCEIWKDMQFNFLYHGRASGAEMAELSEELLHIAKHYMVSNTDNFEETVAGLFLVYALLRLQPYPGFAALRVVPRDVAALQRVEARARRDARYDVLYVLASILIEGPVEFHAADRERGMESSIRKYLEGTTGIDRLGVRPKGVFFRQNEESDLLRELNSITKRYVDAKKALGGESSLGLNYTNEKLATELDSSLKEIINGIVEDGPEATQKMQDHYSKVQEIKAKAMRRSVDGVKHLVTVSDTPTASGSPKPTTEGIARHSVKRKNKNILRQGSTRRSPAASKRHCPSSSSSDELSLSLPSDDDSSQTDGDDVSADVTETVTGDLNLEDFQKAEETQLMETDKDINIEALPSFTRTEQDGQTYEIEVIDNLDEKNELEMADAEELTDEKETLDLGEGTSSGSKEVKASQKDKKSWLKKRDKRELKKTAVMLKFKRMGMLPVANFDDSKRKSPRSKSKKQEEK